jgi:hypothetical protein
LLHFTLNGDEYLRARDNQQGGRWPARGAIFSAEFSCHFANDA